MTLLLTVLQSVGSILVSMLTSLLTEAMIKRVVVVALEKLVARTASDADDKILQEMKKSWGVE